MPPSFRSNVLYIVARIPRGQTMRYGEVARRAGSPKSARAVGAIMRANRDKAIPCHRILRSDGSLGGYNGLAGKKELLLKKEGAL